MLIPYVGGRHDGAALDTISGKVIGYEPTGDVDRTRSIYELEQTAFGPRYVYVFTETLDPWESPDLDSDSSLV